MKGSIITVAGIALLVLVFLIGAPAILPASVDRGSFTWDWLIRDFIGTPQSKVEYFTDQIERPSLGKLEATASGNTLKIAMQADRGAFLRASLHGPSGTQVLFDRKSYRSKVTISDLPDGEYTVTVTPFRCALIPLDLAEKADRQDREVCRNGFTESKTVAIDTGMPAIQATAILDYSSGDGGNVQEVLVVTVPNTDLSGFVRMQVGRHVVEVTNKQALRAEVPAAIANTKVWDGKVEVRLTDAAGNVGYYAIPIDTLIRNGWALMSPTGTIVGIGAQATCVKFFGCPESYVRLHVVDGQIVGREVIDPTWFWIWTIIAAALLSVAVGLFWRYREIPIGMVNAALHILLGRSRIVIPSS